MVRVLLRSLQAQVSAGPLAEVFPLALPALPPVSAVLVLVGLGVSLLKAASLQPVVLLVSQAAVALLVLLAPLASLLQVSPQVALLRASSRRLASSPRDRVVVSLLDTEADKRIVGAGRNREEVGLDYPLLSPNNSRCTPWTLRQIGHAAATAFSEA